MSASKSKQHSSTSTLPARPLKTSSKSCMKTAVPELLYEKSFPAHCRAGKTR